MGTEQRPYVGTWKLQDKKVVQHTPDCLIYINGDLTIPGVDTKGQQYRIDIQKYVTSVQVDCANTPSGASANISLAIPTHSNEPISRDANNIITVGLEVHIYMRGYFPVRGLFRGAGDNVAVYDDNGDLVQGSFSEDEIGVGDFNTAQVTQQAPGPSFPMAVGDMVIPDWIKDAAKNKGSLTKDQVERWAEEMGISFELLVMAITLESESSAGKPDADFIVSSMLNRLAYNSQTGHYADNMWDLVTNKNGNVNYTAAQGESKSGSRQFSTKAWYDLVKHDGHSQYGLTTTINKIYEVLTDRVNGTVYENTHFFHYGSQLASHNKEQAEIDAGRSTRSTPKHSHPSVVHNRWTGRGLIYIQQSVDSNIRIYKKPQLDFSIIDHQEQYDRILNNQQPVTFTALLLDGTNKGKYIGQEESVRPKSRYDDLFAYPYYHVFHGVTINVSFSYSPGVQTVSVQCGSMLHFWSYQNMSTNAAAFGARPSNSKNRVSLLGHNFTGKHPYEIVYTLFHDTAGAAGSVSFVMNQKTNVDTVLGENSLFSLNIKYWEKRFSQRIMGLRLHGATGALFNTLQATAMSQIDTDEMQAAFNSRNPRLGGQGASASVLQGLRSLGLVEGRAAASQAVQQQQQQQQQANSQAQGHQVTEAQLDQAGFGNSGGFEGRTPLDLNIFMMEAFVKDIGQIASINLFESSYETKMDIVNKVCEVTGFEFYQDVDGDCVFKPPMYNLDTSSSRIYRIEDIDMISWNESVKEPEVTFMVTKGSTFANLAGTGVDGEWGVQGTFIDYPLVAKYGWRSGSFETQYFNDSKQCFFACINRMAVMNAGVTTATATIPIRPEMRPGYPVYIPTYDCFYYCHSVSHQYQVGAACQTTLQLNAKRKKFYAPGDPNQSGIESIKLDGFALPPKPLQTLRKDGYSELSGFPNVVMTLDPELINPMFYVSGADFESLTNTENLENLAKILVESSTSGNVFTYDDTNKILSWKHTDQSGAETTKYFSVAEHLGKVGKGTDTNPYKLFAIAGKRDEQRLSTSQANHNSELARQKQVIAGIDESIRKLNKERSKVGAVGIDKKGQANQRAIDGFDDSIRKAEQRKVRAERKLEQIQQRAPSSTNNQIFTPQAQGLDYLVEMLAHVRKYGKYDSNRFGRGFKDLESSANLLDLIGNKKANLSNGQIPGSYRYYSSAHPDPNHQGKKLAYVNTGANSNIATVQAVGSPLTKQKFSVQFLPTANITVSDTIYLQPEAELTNNGQVFNGIPVISASGDEEIVPTDEITTLRFQKVTGKTRVRKWLRSHNYQTGMVTRRDIALGIMHAFGHSGSTNNARALCGFFRPTIFELMKPDANQKIKNGEFATLGISGVYATIGEWLDEWYIEPFEEQVLETARSFNKNPGWGGFTLKKNGLHTMKKLLDHYYETFTGTLGSANGWLPMIYFYPEFNPLWSTEIIGSYEFSGWFCWGDNLKTPDCFPKPYQHFGNGGIDFMGYSEGSKTPFVAKGQGLIDLYNTSIYGLNLKIVWKEYGASIPNVPAITKIREMQGASRALMAQTRGFNNTTWNQRYLNTSALTGNAKFESLTTYGDGMMSNDQWRFGDGVDNHKHLPLFYLTDDPSTPYPGLIELQAYQEKNGMLYGPAGVCNLCIDYNLLWEIDAKNIRGYAYSQGYAGGVGAVDRVIDQRLSFWARMEAIVAESMASVYFDWWEGVEQAARRRGPVYANTVFQVMRDAFNITKQPYSSRMVHSWVWKDITSEVPVFPISDSRGYEVFGHYPYGRGLDIFANNTFDTILKTDPFTAIDRRTVENYVAALQGKTVEITDQSGQINTFSGQDAITESQKQLEIALRTEYSAQEILDYGLGSFNADNRLQISVQNWLADKAKDGVQKLTVENRAYSIADLGFLSDLNSLPSDLKTSQSDVLLPAYSSNFAEVVTGVQSNNSADLLDQLITPTASGQDKTMDMMHTIITQENRSPNWAESQSALRGRSLETRNSADILKEGLETLANDFEKTITKAENDLTKTFEEKKKAENNLKIAFEEPNQDDT